jgi:protein-S-isoprenylcysteine O-methyltransferase Ste14
VLDSIFEWVWLIGFLVFMGIRAWATRGRRQFAVESSRPSSTDSTLLAFSSLGTFLVPLFYLFTPWLGFADYRLPALVGWVGIVVLVAAGWLLWRSHADLGRNWSITVEMREGHSLVTNGAYSRVRHPMYAAHWLWAIAQPLLLQNWIAGFAMLVTFAPLYFHRVGREERMMLDGFGDVYRSYMADTGRVFPRLGNQARRKREK